MPELKESGKFIYADFGRRRIFFADHALDRWWERCKDNGLNGRKAALRELDAQLAGAVLKRNLPPWLRVSAWHYGRSEGFIEIDESRGFVINKNPSRDLVAVTYIENIAKYRRLI